MCRSVDSIFKETEVRFDLVLSNIVANCSGILQIVSNPYHHCARSALLLSAEDGGNRFLRNVLELSQNTKQYYPLWM